MQGNTLRVMNRSASYAKEDDEGRSDRSWLCPWTAHEAAWLATTMNAYEAVVEVEAFLWEASVAAVARFRPSSSSAHEQISCSVAELRFPSLTHGVPIQLSKALMRQLGRRRRSHDGPFDERDPLGFGSRQAAIQNGLASQ
jgi:hypothetical protein